MTDGSTSSEVFRMETEASHMPARSVLKDRKKRFAPKTRTGCLICRARRIKCDEAHPSCRRCVKANHFCRYASDNSTHFATKQFQRDVRVIENADSNVDVSLLKSLLPNYGSLEETCYLGKFLTISAPWLSRYNDGSFFYVVLPQRSWHHPALRHTLFAITMASEQARNPLGFSAGKQHHWHHGEALRHVYTAKDTEEEEEVVLLTSAMMWLHDNITYNSRTAVVHLQGFLRLLTEYRIKRQQRGLPPTDFESQLLRGIIFHADVSGNAFTQVRDRDIVDNIRRRIRDPKYKDKFPTMNGVCDELRLGLTAIPHSSRTLSETAKPGVNTDDCDDSEALSTGEMRIYFEKWYRTFDAIPKSTQADRIMLECHYISAALALQLHQIGLNPHSSLPVDDQQSIDRMEHIMNRLEEIDVACLQQTPSRKDIELPIGQILAQIISLTNNGDIRTRAYNYLRRVKRVEGLWSTDMIADMMWVSHPPDGSRGPPSSFGNFNPPIRDPAPQTLEAWRASNPLRSTADASEQDSLYLRASDTMTTRSEDVDAEFWETRTPSPVTEFNFSNVPQIRYSNGEFDTPIGTEPSVDIQPTGEHAAELLKGGMLIDSMLLGQTTWTRNVTPEWRQIKAKEIAAKK